MLQGVNTPLVTPHSTGSRPDLEGLKRLIDFAANGGVHAICIGGTTGEFIHFSVEDRLKMFAVAVAHSRVPIVAGIAHASLEGALELAKGAADSGTCAL